MVCKNLRYINKGIVCNSNKPRVQRTEVTGEVMYVHLFNYLSVLKRIPLAAPPWPPGYPPEVKASAIRIRRRDDLYCIGYHVGKIPSGSGIRVCINLHDGTS